MIPAAGCGRRLNAGRNKILLPLDGRPMLCLAMAPLLASGLVDALVVVVSPDEMAEIEEILEAADLPPAAVVPGGAERADSVRAGLEWLASWRGWRTGARRFAAIHDAARPLLSMALWQEVLSAALRDGAAVPGLPVADTLKRVGEGNRIEATVDRRDLWSIQTPQVFEFEAILGAHRRAHRAGLAATDDAGILEMTGRQVTVVPGERTNFKITTREDLLLAEAVLAARARVMEPG
ncbi:MAG: 2-C-methyl-D-erythritol 4-phosphate cytidylyltransferase [Patescibacteria group bacterium]